MCMKIEYIHSSLGALSNHLTYVASNYLLHMELTINTKTKVQTWIATSKFSFSSMNGCIFPRGNLNFKSSAYNKSEIIKKGCRNLAS